MIWKAYLDHAYAQNLAKPPFMRICRKFENRRDLRALSGKFLQQISCYPESFRFLWLCPSPHLGKRINQKIPSCHKRSSWLKVENKKSQRWLTVQTQTGLVTSKDERWSIAYLGLVRWWSWWWWSCDLGAGDPVILVRWWWPWWYDPGGMWSWWWWCKYYTILEEYDWAADDAADIFLFKGWWLWSTSGAS